MGVPILFLWTKKMRLYKEKIKKGIFVSRPNRFVARVEIQGKTELCHMPNPGRMRELLFPGTVMYVIKNHGAQSKTAYKVVGAERDGVPVLLDTVRANDVAEYLITMHRIPGWESCRVIRREVTMGDSRFDLLLMDEATGEVFPVEVKSCTLFGSQGAMFPDAVTARGRKHVEHLGKIAEQGGHAGILFLVQWSRAKWFLPDFHTDPEFAETFSLYMDKLDWKAAAISWSESFDMPESVKLLPSSREVIQEENREYGNFLLVLNNEKELAWPGQVSLPAGYYLYVGHSEGRLTAVENSFRRKRRTWRNPVDRLRASCQLETVITLRSSVNNSEPIQKHLIQAGGQPVVLSDDSGKAACLYYHNNPIETREFSQVELFFAMDRFNECMHMAEIKK